MAIMGIGANSYYAVRKEPSYGGSITGVSEKYLPVKAESLIRGIVEDIENANLINSRLAQTPDTGRTLVNGQIVMDLYPADIGVLLNMFLGGATSSNNGDGSYTHYWLAPTSGSNMNTFYNIEQAQGAELAERFSGCIITGITISGEAGQNLQVTANILGKDYTTDVTRATSLTYSSTHPFNFAEGLLEITPTGVTKFNQCVNSFSIEINLNYVEERFKICSDNTAQEPLFNGIPTATMTINIDADQKFIDYARAKTNIDLLLTLTSSSLAGTTDYYEMTIDFPKCRINPETVAENTSENMSMDVEFMCSYGGNTTNGTNVQFEIGLVDTESSYTVSS